MVFTTIDFVDHKTGYLSPYFEFLVGTKPVGFS